MVVAIPYERVSMEVSSMRLRRRSTNEMPRDVVTFAHAQAGQIAIHETVDVSHLVAGLEPSIVLKIKK